MAIGKKLLTVLLYLIAGIILTWALWIGPGPRPGTDDQLCGTHRFFELDRSVPIK